MGLNLLTPMLLVLLIKLNCQMVRVLMLLVVLEVELIDGSGILRGLALEVLEDFAETGGYSPEDIQNIRARAVSPIRSVYSSAKREIDRQRSLQGGYSPNRTAALAKMAREQGYVTSDASTNVESAIAQMINEGKRFGLSGGASLYGTTPGLASTFGSQALQGQQLQNQAANMFLNQRLASQQLPGPYETTVGRVGSAGGAIFPWL
jgi:hypothetical protein